MVSVGQMISEADVRPILTIALIIASSTLMIVDGAIPEWLQTLTIASVGYFFTLK